MKVWYAAWWNFDEGWKKKELHNCTSVASLCPFLIPVMNLAGLWCRSRSHTESLHAATTALLFPSPWEHHSSHNPFPGHNDYLTRFTLGGSPSWRCVGGLLFGFVCPTHLTVNSRSDFTLTPSKRGGGKIHERSCSCVWSLKIYSVSDQHSLRISTAQGASAGRPNEFPCVGVFRTSHSLSNTGKGSASFGTMLKKTGGAPRPTPRQSLVLLPSQDGEKGRRKMKMKSGPEGGGGGGG